MEEEKEEIRESSFDWKIAGFLEKIHQDKISDAFKFGTHGFKLIIKGIDNSCNLCLCYFPVYLSVENGSIKLNDQIYFKMSLIGRCGKEYVRMRRTSLQPVNRMLLLMVIRTKELTNNMKNLLPEGTLTLKLSWYEERERCTQTPLHIKVNDSNQLFEKLSEDFGAFYRRQTNTDCILRIGNVQYPVHRAVLSARSEIFEAMFRHDTSENRSGVVDITDGDSSVMDDVLYYIYAGEIRGLTIGTAAPMYYVADKYALTELRDACTDFLMHNLTLESVSGAAVLANKHAEKELEDQVIQFIGENADELLENKTWKEFAKKNSFLAYKYLHAALVSCNKKLNSK